MAALGGGAPRPAAAAPRRDRLADGSQRPAESEFRHVLGHFATGVAVVTGGPGHDPAGFTCQSFSSLSLDPPMVVMLPNVRSRSWPAIRAHGRFCVNILSSGQQDLSRRFATAGLRRFAGVRWTASPLGSPLLAGATAWIDCEIGEMHPGGDHVIVVGLVRHCAATGRPPLVFHCGAYHQLQGLLPMRHASTPVNGEDRQL